MDMKSFDGKCKRNNIKLKGGNNIKPIVKDSIFELRKLNYSYACIGEKLGISPNTVKSLCRRSGIQPWDAYKTKQQKADLEVCKYCGKFLIQNSRQHKTFCNDSCRMAYWKEARRKR